MWKRILVPLDGSKQAELGLAMAARLARKAGSELLLLRIISVPPFPFAPYGEPAQITLALIEAARDEAESYLRNVSESMLVKGITVRIMTLEGHVSSDILDTARTEECDLIMLTAHGYGGLGRWRLGRVAEQVVRHSLTPVLIVPAHAAVAIGVEAEAAPIRVLAPLDGSELAEAATQPAVNLALALTAPERITIHLVQIVDPITAVIADASEGPLPQPEIGPEERALDLARSYLGGVASNIQRENPTMTVTFEAVIAQDVAAAICEIAEEEPHADVLAMATHGRGGMARWAMGSISERVLHTTHVPLLVVRSPGAITADRLAVEAAEEAKLHQ
ncbi:MAG TPA: universal stress protein [Ktedonobacterales bacterium]